jgi:hypothetical protein
LDQACSEVRGCGALQVVVRALSTLGSVRVRYNDLLFEKACEYGQTAIIRHLIDGKLVDLQRIEWRGFDKAAAYMYRNIIEILLEYHADINHMSPISSAIEHGNLSIMKLMLHHGATISPAVLRRCELYLNKWGYTRLRDFDRHDSRPMAIYVAAKLGGEMQHRRLCCLVEDVEDSKFWSKKVTEVGMLTDGDA